MKTEQNCVNVEPVQYKIAIRIGAQIVTGGDGTRAREAPKLYLEVRQLNVRRQVEKEIFLRLNAIEHREGMAVLVENEESPIADRVLGWTVAGANPIYRVQLVVFPKPAETAFVGEVAEGKIYEIDPLLVRPWYVRSSRRGRQAA